MNRFTAFLTLACLVGLTSAHADPATEIQELKQRVSILEERLETLGAGAMPFLYVGETETVNEVDFTFQGCEIRGADVECFLSLKNSGFRNNISINSVLFAANGTSIATRSTQTLHLLSGMNARTRTNVPQGAITKIVAKPISTIVERDDTRKYSVLTTNTTPSRSYGLRVSVKVGDTEETLNLRGVLN